MLFLCVHIMLLCILTKCVFEKFFKALYYMHVLRSQNKAPSKCLKLYLSNLFICMLPAILVLPTSRVLTIVIELQLVNAKLQV